MVNMPAHAAIVIPCFNAEIWIEKAVRSALEQSFSETTLIVVDDGSTDGSVERIQNFAGHVILETGPHCGACHARNRGLELATGQGASHVLFLDADDYLEGDLLAGAMQVAERHDADMVLSNMHIEYADGSRDIRHAYKGHVLPEQFFAGWMDGDFINPSGILWRTDFISRIGGWDESLARAQDFDITMRAMFQAPVIYKNETGAAIHTRVNANSITTDQSYKALASRFAAVASLLDRAKGTPFAKFTPQLCREIYHISRAAFRAGYTDLGRMGLRRIHAEGYHEHPGTWGHALAARILGLEMKTRLWRR